MAFQWGVEYFQIYSISLLFLLLLHVFGSCYRGMGDTKTSMKIMLVSLIMNMVLDPILIFGLGPFSAMGVKGAALASLISQVFGVLIYIYLVFIKQQHMQLNGSWRLDGKVIKKSLAIGLPSGLAYFLLTANMLITYRVVSPYGTQALASLGIGFRIIQTMYLPSVAIADATAAMVGQNFGAKEYKRVKTTFWTGLRISCVFMTTGTLLCWLLPSFFIHLFSQEPDVVFYGVAYLKIISLSNLTVGAILTMSAVFQGIGKTYPTLVSAVLDNILFATAIFTLPIWFDWGITSVWWIKFVTALFEMILLCFWLTYRLKHLEKGHS